MIKRKIKLALLQLDLEIALVEQNIEKSIEGINEAVSKGANFICLPEGFNTGYDCDRYPEMISVGEELSGSTITKLQKIAREKSIHIVAPITLVVMTGVYENSAILIDDKGDILGSYSKTHLVGEEQLYYKRGTDYPVFKTEFGNIGIVICYDVCFPETTRLLAIKGADMILVSAAWRKDYETWWDVTLACRAIDNTVYVGAVNRVGETKNSSFMGKSKVVNPKGEVVVECSGNNEEICLCEIDLNSLNEERQINTVLIDRHPEDYKLLSIK
jgi:predicted amidohydrolase